MASVSEAIQASKRYLSPWIASSLTVLAMAVWSDIEAVFHVKQAGALS